MTKLRLLLLFFVACAISLGAKNYSQKDLEIRYIKELSNIGGTPSTVVAFGGDKAPKCLMTISRDGADFLVIPFIPFDTSCKTLTNSKGVEIVCNKNKSVCKTRSELIDFVKNINGINDTQPPKNEIKECITRIQSTELVSDIFKSLPKKCKSAKAVVLSAVKEDWNVLEHVNPSLRKDKHIVMEAIKQNGLALQYADTSLQKDKEVVTTAIKNFGRALKYVNPSFKKKRELVLTAIANDAEAFKYADASLKKDRNFIFDAIRINAGVFQYINHTLQENRQFVLDAISHNANVFKYLSKQFKQDKEIAKAAISRNINMLREADDALRQDTSFIASLASNNIVKYDEHGNMILPKHSNTSSKNGDPLIGDYIGADGCEDSHGFGMYTTGLKIFKSDNDYYALRFDIRCAPKKDFFIIRNTIISDSIVRNGLHFDLTKIQKTNDRYKLFGKEFILDKEGDLTLFVSDKTKAQIIQLLEKHKDTSDLDGYQKRKLRRYKQMISPGGKKFFINTHHRIATRVFATAKEEAVIHFILNDKKEEMVTIAKSGVNFHKRLTLKNSNGKYKTLSELKKEIKQNGEESLEYTSTDLYIEQPSKTKDKINTNTGRSTLKTDREKRIASMLKKSLRYILHKNFDAFDTITDSGRIYDKNLTKQEFERGRLHWERDFSFLDNTSTKDLKSLKITQIPTEEKAKTCRYIPSGKTVSCQMATYCFTIKGKPLYKNGCVDIYTVDDKLYWEPFGW